jgi:hypothetical protein
VSGGAVYTVFTVIPGSNVTANGWSKTLCLSQHPIAIPVLTAIVAVSPSIGDKPVVWCGVRVKVEPSPRRIGLTRVTASRGVCRQICVPTDMCADRCMLLQKDVQHSVCHLIVGVPFGIPCAIGCSVCHWTSCMSFTSTSNCTPPFQHTYVDRASQYVV